MKYAVPLLLVLLLSACASTQKETSNISNTPAPTTQTSSATAIETAPTRPDPALSSKTLDHSAQESSQVTTTVTAPPKESVFFDLDQSLIKPEFADVIKSQATFIRGHANDKVTLEGNCDERGSSEYNLALGNRRATTVEKHLQALGVPSEQIRVVSLGEENPKTTCHEESCWKENRRVDFVHQLK